MRRHTRVVLVAVLLLAVGVGILEAAIRVPALWEAHRAACHQNPILAKFSICSAIRNCRVHLGTWPDSPEHMARLGGKAPAYRPYLTDRMVVLGPGDFTFRRLCTSFGRDSARYEIRFGKEKPARCDLFVDRTGPQWVR